jgi:NOL1/NOP2/sun family putative RNA methylase
MFEPKPLFAERIRTLLGNETEQFFDYCFKPLPDYIRANKIKILPSELSRNLSKVWRISQPFYEYPEIIKVNSKLDGSPLEPGELGKTKEHLLGYYYVQGLSSMMPVIALAPTEKESVLDLCASPGSKTTQLASEMKNSGMLIANDSDLSRIIVLNSNLERCGVTNCIVTREDGARLCEKFSKLGIQLDKILVDTSCSGEGVIRENPKTIEMWNYKMIQNFAAQQKRLAASAFPLLKEGGEMVYSTCTLAPEENEEVIQFLIDNFNAKIEEIKLPIKTREGIASWQGREFSREIKKCCRIYPQDNDSEGFFVAKIKKT